MCAKSTIQKEEGTYEKQKKFLAGMLAATMVLNMALSVDVSAEEGSEAQTAKNTVVEMNETAVAENNVYYVSSDGNDEIPV